MAEQIFQTDADVCAGRQSGRRQTFGCGHTRPTLLSAAEAAAAQCRNCRLEHEQDARAAAGLFTERQAFRQSQQRMAAHEAADAARLANWAARRSN